MRIVMEIETTGYFNEQELKDFIEFELQGGSLNINNPFIQEDSDAEIIRVDIE